MSPDSNPAPEGQHPTITLSFAQKSLLAAILTILTLLAIFLVAEGFLRWQANRAGQSNLSVQWVYDNGFYYHPPRTRFTMPNEKGDMVEIQIDDWGLRNSRHFSDRKKILVLGDSYIEADNTPEDQTFTAALAARLHDRHPGWTVVNGGLNGYSNYESYLLLKHLAKTGLKPDAVILGVCLANDLHDNFFSFGRGIPAAPSGSAAPGLIDRAAGGLKRLLKKSHLVLYVHGYLKTAREPYYSYYLFEVESYRTTPEPYVLEAVSRTRQTLRLLKEFCDGEGIKLGVLLIPPKSQVYEEFLLSVSSSFRPEYIQRCMDIIRGGYSFDRPAEYFRDVCLSMQIPLFDLLPLYRRHRAEKIFYKIDGHWTPLGQSMAADLVVQEFPSDFLVTP